MLNNLEAQIDNFEVRIDVLEDECSENNEQMEQQRAALQAKQIEIEEKYRQNTEI